MSAYKTGNRVGVVVQTSSRAYSALTKCAERYKSEIFENVMTTVYSYILYNQDTTNFTILDKEIIGFTSRSLETGLHCAGFMELVFDEADMDADAWSRSVGVDNALRLLPPKFLEMFASRSPQQCDLRPEVLEHSRQ